MNENKIIIKIKSSQINKLFENLKGLDTEVYVVTSGLDDDLVVSISFLFEEEFKKFLRKYVEAF